MDRTMQYRLFGSLAFCGLLLAHGRTFAELPNVVVILADDLGSGDLGCYGATQTSTPNLDRLAREGMRFTDAHSPSAVCTPTRYGLLTGRYCFRSRLKRGVLVPWDPPLIEPGRLTVAALLKQHGYATACVGRWPLCLQCPTKDGAKPARKDGLAHVDFARPIPDRPSTPAFDSYFRGD